MKEPIALLVNDIHVSKDNISEFQANWYEMLQIADEDDIQDIIIGGDLWHSRSSQTLGTILSVKNALEEALAHDKKLTIAEGNHDKVDLEDLVGYNHIFHSFSKDIEIVDDHRLMCWGGCDFVLVVMSYFPERGSFKDRLEIAVKDAFNQYPDVVKTKDNIILYCHAGIQGALSGMELPNEAPQEWFKGFRKVLVGHYHDPKRIKNTNIEYIGASRQHSFGETESKGYTILYSDGSTKFIYNNINLRYMTVELTPDQIDGFDLLKEYPHLNVVGAPSYKCRAKVICNKNESKLIDRNKLYELGFDKVEIKDVSEQNDEKLVVFHNPDNTRYDHNGIRKEYENYCNENEIDNRLGLKYLV